MREILLTQGQVAIVDDEDFERVNVFKWCAHRTRRGGKFYAVRRLPGGSLQRMHAFIVGFARPDHKDGNSLDNRRENLRPATEVENNRAFREKSSSATSQYRGVAFDNGTKRWRSKIMLSGRTVHLGRFDLETDAAKAYDKAAREHFKEFASPNFPNE